MNQTTDKTTIYADALTYDFIHTGTRGRDFDFYKSLAVQGESILEIACGTGRLTIPLAESGFKMTGLDISQSMLDEAQVKAKRAKAEIKWVHADCRNFSLMQKFPLIFMGCNSLQHLHKSDQVTEFFKTIKNHLQPGGIFACDIFKPDLRILNRDPAVRHHVLKYTNADGTEVLLDETNSYDEVSQVNRITWYHSAPGGNLLKSDSFEMRQFFPQELEYLFSANGLRITEKFGNWDRKEMGGNNFKQIIVAKAY